MRLEARQARVHLHVRDRRGLDLRPAPRAATRPPGGGEPRILIPADKKGIWHSDARLAPNGQGIAYIVFDRAQYAKEGMYSIWTMEVEGGTPRHLTNGGEYVLCWSPDGKWIAYEKRIKDMDFELYKIPAEAANRSG